MLDPLLDHLVAAGVPSFSSTANRGAFACRDDGMANLSESFAVDACFVPDLAGRRLCASAFAVMVIVIIWRE
jgi:hypothetical protein